jgi:hypothetical protein
MWQPQLEFPLGLFLSICDIAQRYGIPDFGHVLHPIVSV